MGSTNGAASRSDGLVLFGATGDLARKKIFPAVYEIAARTEPVPVVGVASSELSSDELRERMRSSILAAHPEADARVLDELCARTSYVSGDYREASTYEQLKEELSPCSSPLFYLAIPPALFDDVVTGLAKVGLNEHARVVVEKPFGRDSASAAELNDVLHQAFPEDAVFRIDHFVGKESVESLLVFRFANAVLEPVWNNRYISHVQLTMAEDFGVEGRGKFYESVGALRDVVQNHLLQIVALLGMEPPVDLSADRLHDERVKLFRQVRAVDPGDVVRGQYRGYVDEAGVAGGSDVETFVALRFWIDSWRWAGVPFLIRAGKCLAGTATEAVVEFKQPPRLLFPQRGGISHPNHLRFRLGRDDGVTLTLQAKAPGDRMASEPVALDVSYEAALGHRQDAYERLLDDAMTGDTTRFGREDSLMEQWRIVDRVLEDPAPVELYARGSWGPEATDRLLPEGATWYEPR